MRRKAGFTLIELLIVISLIGILAGVLIAVINVPEMRNRAKDSVRMANVEKAATGVESYYAGEGSYPTTPGDALLLSVYMKAWPTEPAGSSYVYFRDGLEFGIYVLKESTGGGCFKYHSSWGRVRECPTASCANNAGC